jgi:membrane protein implicated in regulation of membrane protease activity
VNWEVLVVLLGVLLVLVAAGAAVWLVLGSQAVTAPVNLHTAGLKIGMTPLALLVTGAVILLVFWVGLALIRGSVKRRRRPAREAREAQRRAELEENIRADERSRAEETHRSALAERDRVREDEFQSRLAERDRLRDEDEQRRMTEAEQRIRADERQKIESEYRDRPGDALTAGGLSGGTAQDGGFADSASAYRDGTASHGTGAGEYTGSHASNDMTDSGGTSDSNDATDSAGTSDSNEATESTRASDSNDATDSNAPHHDRFRTVADKLMGREPTGEA